MGRDELLARLRDLSSEKPTTQMGQLRWAWPEIQAALAAGHTLRRVHQRLECDGLRPDIRRLIWISLERFTETQILTNASDSADTCLPIQA